MLLFSGFFIIHVLMVALVYFGRNVRLITLGSTDANFSQALTVFIAGLLLLFVFNVIITFLSLRYRVGMRRILVTMMNPVIHGLFGKLRPTKNYKKADISEFFHLRQKNLKR